MGSYSDASGSGGVSGCLSLAVQEEMEAKDVRKGEDQSSTNTKFTIKTSNNNSNNRTVRTGDRK